MTNGIPQESVLGPLLFIIFAKDLLGCVQASTKIFADDTNIYTEIKDQYEKIQQQAENDNANEDFGFKLHYKSYR